MAKYLDKDGVTTLWNRSKETFAKKEETYKLTNYANILQMLVEGSTINQEIEDNTKSYVKDVPEKSSSIAKIKEIGGMCYKISQLVKNGNFESTSGWGINGGTIIVANNKATITSNTSNSNVNWGRTDISIIDTHIYLQLATIKIISATNQPTNLLGMQDATYAPVWLNVTNPVIGQTYQATRISTLNSSANRYYFQVSKANSSDEVVVECSNVELIDLTSLYGKGKEPTTVEQFLEDYPMFNDYVEYNDGVVTETKVTSIDCVGANIWDEEIEIGGLNITDGAANGNVGYLRSKFNMCLPNTIYFMNSGSHSDMGIWFYDVNRNFISKQYKHNTTFTTPLRAYYFKICWYGTTYKNDIAIIKGTSGTYTPYRHKNYPINESIQSLDGYGLGINASLYNYIDFENKKFIKKVRKYVFKGNEEWVYYANGHRWAAINLSGSLAKVNSNLLTNVPNIVNYGNTYDVDKSIYIGNFNNKLTIQIADSTNLPSTTTKQEVRDYLKGKVLYYELETYEEVDLKDIIKDDAFLDVESKGTITFNNEKQFDFPNNVMFFIKQEDSKSLIPTKTSQLTNDSGYLVKDSDISVSSVTSSGNIKSTIGTIEAPIIDGETLKENGVDISQIYQPKGDYALASAVTSLEQAVDTLESDVLAIETGYEKKKTTTLIFNTNTSVGTITGAGTTISKTITLTDSVQAGDRLKVYVGGNTAYAQYNTAIIEFELFNPTSSTLGGAGTTMVYGASHGIVTARVQATSTTTTSLTVECWCLDASEYAAASVLNILKVERIR